MKFENTWNTNMKKGASKEIIEGVKDYLDEKNQSESQESDFDNKNYLHNDENMQIPDTLMSTDNFIAKYGYKKAEEIYNAYSQAMERKKDSHGRIALDQESFMRHFFEGGSFDASFMYGDIEKGFLLGVLKYNIFIPTHFAPKSLRKGYELFKELGDDQLTPAVLMITDDLVQTINKMESWHAIDMTIIQQFMQNDVEKTLVHNNHPDIKQLLYAFAYEYMQDKSI